MIVSASGYAEIRNKSPAWVTSKIADGLPVITEGERFTEYQIDVAAAIDWELSQERSKRGEDSSSDRLRRAQAERAERENLEAAGALIPVDEHTDFVCELANQFVRLLTGLPGRLAGELAAITDPALMRARLQDEIGTIRNTLATRCGNAADRVVQARDAVAEASADPELAASDVARPVG